MNKLTGIKQGIVVFMIVLLIGCQKTETLKLLELEGTSVDDVNAFVEMYESHDVKGDIKSSIVVEDLDYAINGYHLYQSQVDYAWSYDIMLEKDDELMLLPSGYMPMIYEVDTDGDGVLELLLVGDIGSGLRIIQVTHFDTGTGKMIVQTFYNNNDGIVFDVVNDEIMAYHDYSFDKRSTDPIGKLIIGESIEIEGLESHAFEGENDEAND